MNAQEEMAQLESERRRGMEAEMLLNHPLFQEARKAFYEDLSQQRQACPMRDTDLHTRLVLAEQVGAKVFTHLEAIMRQGEAAKLVLREREKFSERLKYAMEHGLRNAF